MVWWLFWPPMVVNLHDIRYPLSGDMRGWTNSLFTQRDLDALDSILTAVEKLPSANKRYAARLENASGQQEITLAAAEISAPEATAPDTDIEIVRNLLDRLRQQLPPRQT
ncbi:hypothetical protein [Phaeospirillum tilakii]|uniref:Uncharacterized protein n=1 Tax=Phaeospirillum tilakii TaxID=741673 RepID=A0ABW5CBB8_9PROT